MSRFWSLGRSAAPAATATAAAIVEPELEPVELYTREAMVLGLVTPDGERLSDILNRERALLVHQPQVTSYLETPSDDVRVASFATDEILLAMPPTHTPHPARRIHRKRRRVVVKVDNFEIVGTAHMPPGADLDPYVLRTRAKFVAMTDALVRYVNDPVFARSAPVVLVNTTRMTQVDDLLQVE